MIARYTSEIQSLLNAKTKAEPWLHIAFTRLNCGPAGMAFAYAIYVWDTRKVIETNLISDNVSTRSNAGTGLRGIKTMPANDNHEQLHGDSFVAIDSHGDVSMTKQPDDIAQHILSQMSDADRQHALATWQSREQRRKAYNQRH